MGQTEWEENHSRYLRNDPVMAAEMPNEYSDIAEGDYKHGIYGAYRDELKEKLDEICAKYDLKLHTDEQSAGSYDELCSKLGYVPIKNLEEGVFSSTYYDAGAFYLDNFHITSEYSLNFSFHYNLTGVMHDVRSSINDPVLYEEQIVTSGDDVRILAAGSGPVVKRPRTILFIPLDGGDDNCRSTHGAPL